MSSATWNPTGKSETLPSCFNLHACNLFIYAGSMRNIMQLWFAAEKKIDLFSENECIFSIDEGQNQFSIEMKTDAQKGWKGGTQREKKQKEKPSCCIALHNLSTSLILLPYSQTSSFYQHYRENMNHFFTGSNVDEIKMRVPRTK